MNILYKSKKLLSFFHRCAEFYKFWPIWNLDAFLLTCLLLGHPRSKWLNMPTLASKLIINGKNDCLWMTAYSTFPILWQCQLWLTHNAKCQDLYSFRLFLSKNSIFQNLTLFFILFDLHWLMVKSTVNDLRVLCIIRNTRMIMIDNFVLFRFRFYEN